MFNLHSTAKSLKDIESLVCGNIKTTDWNEPFLIEYGNIKEIISPLFNAGLHNKIEVVVLHATHIEPIHGMEWYIYSNFFTYLHAQPLISNNNDMVNIFT